MFIKRIISLQLFTLIMILTTSCNQHTLSISKEDIFVSDALAIYQANPFKEEKHKLMSDTITDLSFNTEKQSVFSPNRHNSGFVEITNSTIKQCPTELTAPHHIYSYKNYVVLDSFQIQHDVAGNTMGFFGVYDTKDNKMIRKYKVYGDFRAITGHNNFAYVTTFAPEKNNSNVYEINLDTLSMRPLLHSPQSRAPKLIHDEKGNSYGLYTHWESGPANQIVKINMNTGKIKKISNLDPYAYNMTIVKNRAIIVHYDDMNAEINIPKPITIINLDTGTTTKMSLDSARPTYIVPYQKQLAAVADDNGFLLVIDPIRQKILKKQFISSTGLYSLATTA